MLHYDFSYTSFITSTDGIVCYFCGVPRFFTNLPIFKITVTGTKPKWSPYVIVATITIGLCEILQHVFRTLVNSFKDFRFFYTLVFIMAVFAIMAHRSSACDITSPHPLGIVFLVPFIVPFFIVIVRSRRFGLTFLEHQNFAFVGLEKFA